MTKIANKCRRTLIALSLFMLISMTIKSTYCNVADNYDNTYYNLLPSPYKMKSGNKTFYLNHDCKFILFVDESKQSHQSSNIYEIVKIYDEIINSNKIKSDLPQKCDIPIKIKISNSKMMKYNADYQTNYEAYSLSMKLNQDNDTLTVDIEVMYLNGLIRALETLSQIIVSDPDTKNSQINNLPLTIFDRPEFKYRGVMIDTSRHYLSPSKIKEIITGMMFNKLNVLHWHMVDDEYFTFGTKFRLKNDRYIYSYDVIIDIIDFAFKRGVTVIPEIDTPSHTLSWKNIDPSIVLSKPESGTLDPSKDRTYTLVDSIIKEVLTLFSSGKGELMHLGGDEVAQGMLDTPEIKEFMEKNKMNDTIDLINYYMNRVRNSLPKDKNYAYWVTNDSTNNPHYDVYDLHNSVLVYWGIQDSLKEYLDTFPNQDISRNLILCSGDYLYLDCGSGNKYGDDTWCGDYKTWKTIYNFPVFKSYNKFRVIGSQVVLFGELADEESVVGKIFPRAASLAERLWSTKQADDDDFYVRLIKHNRRLKERGVKTISFTTQYCENNPGECVGEIALGS